MKREKHRAAIALPGAFFDVGGEARGNIYVAAAGRRMCRHVWTRTGGDVGRMAAAPPSGKKCDRGFAFLPR